VARISANAVPWDRTGAAFAPAAPRIGVLVLGPRLVGRFAIVAAVLAFLALGLAGFARAIILGRVGFGQVLDDRLARCHGERAAGAVPRPLVDFTGHDSFDADRGDVMKRLDSERRAVLRFLDRLPRLGKGRRSIVSCTAMPGPARPVRQRPKPKQRACPPHRPPAPHAADARGTRARRAAPAQPLGSGLQSRLA
jgi:hypothetical protein